MCPHQRLRILYRISRRYINAVLLLLLLFNLAVAVKLKTVQLCTAAEDQLHTIISFLCSCSSSVPSNWQCLSNVDCQQDYKNCSALCCAPQLCMRMWVVLAGGCWFRFGLCCCRVSQGRFVCVSLCFWFLCSWIFVSVLVFSSAVNFPERHDFKMVLVCRDGRWICLLPHSLFVTEFPELSVSWSVLMTRARHSAVSDQTWV